MIKSFKKYENLSFDEINMDYLIGLPSGQIIDIHYTEINNLKQQGFVVFNKKLMSYVYNDDNHESILWYLKRNKDEEEDNPYSTYLSDEKLDEIQDFFDKQKLVDNYMLVQGGKIDVYGSVVVKNDKNGFFPIYSEITSKAKGSSSIAIHFNFILSGF